MELEKRIQVLDGKDDEGELSVDDREERRQLLANLGQVRVKQEAILQQKARVRWVSQGDLNTKFYHSSIKWRRIHNGINGLKVGDQWRDDPIEVKARVKEFFEGRFSGGGRQLVRLDNVRFNGISREDNEMLVGVIYEAEVKEAVWNCDSSKSPGPDGFNFGFIKFCWDIIKGDVMSAVKSFAKGGSWPKGTNASFITLVPKVVNPQHLNDFRPISLVGCVYKIVSKILSSRMKRV